MQKKIILESWFTSDWNRWFNHTVLSHIWGCVNLIEIK